MCLSVSVCVCFRLGAVLGVGVCLTAMCVDGKTDTRVHVTTTQAKLAQALEIADTTDNVYQVGLHILHTYIKY